MGTKLPAVIQIVGYKNTGKTTLICKLIERFAAAGLRVGTVKHDGHDFEPDVPGTDSWQHRRAGAKLTAVASDDRTAFFEERGATLDELLLRLGDADVVIVEGWKRERYAKVAMVQTEEQLDAVAGLPGIVAAATWNGALRPAIAEKMGVPVFDVEHAGELALWIRDYLSTK